MSNVVRFRNAKEREDEDLRAAALEVIEAFGPAAGLEVGRAAHAWRLSPGSRARLLALADEIESVQGYGWWWGEAAAADNASSSPTGHPAVSPAIPAKNPEPAAPSWTDLLWWSLAIPAGAWLWLWPIWSGIRMFGSP